MMLSIHTRVWELQLCLPPKEIGPGKVWWLQIQTTRLQAKKGGCSKRWVPA